MRWKLLVCLLLFGLLTQSAFAQNSKPTATPSEPPTERAPASVRVPLLSAAIHLSDFAGMKPRPELRDQLAEVRDFIQNTPRDGQPETEKTEVWIGHTKTLLYFVFICYDDKPGEIRGHLSRRENILMDDNVSVLLDPFEDRRKGVLFTVNPAGVQADAAWSENSDPDYSYDQVWDSEGAVIPGGWMALMAIPFRSLRFRSGGPDWGFVLARNLPRNSEQDYYPRIATNISGILSQEGILHGMEGAEGSRNFQFNPYALAQNERRLNLLDPLNPAFSSRHLEGTGGGEAKLIIKDSIVVDGTVNPDFSTVESDQPQFTVNQRFPVVFPELRPFFLENANYFTTPIRMVYTRNIAHPEYGVRLTGKMRSTNLGLLAVDDRSPGESVPPGDLLYKQRATFALGRVSQDLGKNSSIGILYTDREFGGGWNRIGSADLNLRLNDKWTAGLQWAESSTQPDSDSPGTRYAAGPALLWQAQRNGHNFNLFSFGRDYSTGFQTQVGLLQTTNIRDQQAHSNYQWFPKHTLVQSWGIEGDGDIAFDQQGDRFFRYLTADVFVALPRNMVFAPILVANSDTLGPQSGTLFTHNHNFSENGAGVVAKGSPLNQVTFSLQAVRDASVNYNPIAGGLPSLMDQQTVQLLLTVQPIRRLTADNTYLLDRDFETRGGPFVYETQTFRTKINYQFTRAFSARAIVEYDSTLVNPATTSLARTKQIGSQALLTWLPHPGTAVYIGYNNDLQNIGRALCNRLSNGACDPNNSNVPRSSNYLNDGRQLFIKASYLYRF